jgi:hypothetical protein
VSKPKVSSSPLGSGLLGDVPVGLRNPLAEALNNIVRNFREGRWEPAELNGGKICEIVFTIVQGYIDGSFPDSPFKPNNMIDACRGLEKVSSSVPRSVRIQIPRMIVALYEIRNNRGVGHVGGDVNPNHMDAATVLSMSKWLVAELVRLFHQVDTGTATAAVDSLISKELPVVWTLPDRKRVLNAKMSMKDKTLLLLYSESTAVAEAELVSWVEHSNPTIYRRDVLRPSHRSRLIEYDQAARTVLLSPLGAAYVEERLLPPAGSA